ncbi:MAG: hypothetical protein P0Y64_11070 [Candidatus Sphingomonas colombiensis]|nr:hypothetical protein [Sphingomonas sp.]WEK41937.1 MAG: hypothetical protein P0Y64_11070 [Sphingomonas sp.]
MTDGPVRFEIIAASDPQSLPRLINYFAQRDVIPSLVRVEARGASMHFVIELPALAAPHAAIIAEKMRASVLVERVAWNDQGRIESLRVRC